MVECQTREKDELCQLLKSKGFCCRSKLNVTAGKLSVVVVGWGLAHPASRPTGVNLRVVAFRSCLAKVIDELMGAG